MTIVAHTSDNTISEKAEASFEESDPQRLKVGLFFDAINLKSIGFSKEGITLARFEQRMSKAYAKQKLDPPSDGSSPLCFRIFAFKSTG